MRTFHWLVVAVLFCTALVSCSDEEPATPLDPPALEDVVQDAKEVVSVNYNKYIGGEVIGQGVANYYFMLANTKCELDERDTPRPVENGDLVVLDLYGAVSPEGKVVVPEGVYTLGYKYNPSTFNVDNTFIIRNHDAQILFQAVSGGTVEVSHKNDAVHIECRLELASGELACYSFTGSLQFEDITDTWGAQSTLKVDMVDTPFVDVWAAYYGNMFETGTGNFMVYFYTDGFADDMTQKGSMLALCLFSNLVNDPANAALKEGEYHVVPLTDGYGDKFTMMGGTNIGGQPFGTYVQKVDADGYKGLGFITKGTVKVSKVEGKYQFDYDLWTDNRKHIKGVFEKEMVFENQSSGGGASFLSTLEEDIHTELPMVTKAEYAWKGEITGANAKQLDLWQVLLEAPQGDGMILEFATETGLNGQIPDGTYTTDTHYWGERFTTSTAVAGHLSSGVFRGCWYVHYKEGSDPIGGHQYYYHIDQHAPAVEEGTVTVKKQENGEFTFEWNFVDDAPGKNKITGKWTGPLQAFGSNSAKRITLAPWIMMDREAMIKGVNEKVFKW